MLNFRIAELLKTNGHSLEFVFTHLNGHTNNKHYRKNPVLWFPIRYLSLCSELKTLSGLENFSIIPTLSRSDFTSTTTLLWRMWVTRDFSHYNEIFQDHYQSSLQIILLWFHPVVPPLSIYYLLNCHLLQSNRNDSLPIFFLSFLYLFFDGEGVWESFF